MSTTIRRSILAALLILAGFAGAATPASAADDPRTFISRLGDETVGLLSASKPTPERRAKLEELLYRAFDFDTVSRLVLGRLWHQATPEQQKAYQEVFADFVVQTYARRLAENEISGYAITDVQPLGDTDTMVETVIERPAAEAVRFGWRVRQKGEDPKIIDVVVEGVSMVVSQRSEFASVVRRDGMDGLIESLRSKVS
ncbi:ABC transporter substrate-binding protein [Rhodospirillaceae bacterium SYSU D60014]|uniref:MlaC/ttg2D family ABC transporter substrate-binding protein n=1 Tax=Virgifigura deserti TaxID=2268457 RepID=UPI000E6645C2